MNIKLELSIHPQPDDSTCGPTCLHAVYKYFGDSISLNQVIAEVATLKGGGTLGVMLANHALSRGYQASIYTYNLVIFDPTWFADGVDIDAKLAQRSDCCGDSKQRLAIEQYRRFLQQGGTLFLPDLKRSLLRHFLKRGVPVLTGLNSTFLYRTMRVYGDEMKDDDVRGDVVGHFVVLHGYDRERKTVMVADPYKENPYSRNHLYEAELDRVIGSMYLGVMTYDANFVIIEPPGRHRKKL